MAINFFEEIMLMQISIFTRVVVHFVKYLTLKVDPVRPALLGPVT